MLFRSWTALIPSFVGKFQTSTLRNVGQVPPPAGGYPTGVFVKAFMHNGYLLSLKEVVHFYNTRTSPRSMSCRGTVRQERWKR